MDPHECDYENPESVVAAFIRAMNAWELFAARHQKKEGSTPWPVVNREMGQVFSRYCTPKERPFGRQGSFQSPPEYDPAREEIVVARIESPMKALVDTRREAILGGGEYRYVLHRVGERWLIDNLKFKEEDGSFSKAIL